MSNETTFAFMIDTSLSETELFRELLVGLTNTQQVGGYIKCGKNVLNLDKNSLYDKSIASEQGEDSWMYYGYELSVFPDGRNAFAKGEDVLANQREAASNIMHVLQKVGAKVKLLADFEL